MIKVYDNLEVLSRAVADYIVELSKQSIEANGVFNIALAGGSTPKKLYELLAGEYKEKIVWPRWQVFFSDERFVSLDDGRSNFGSAYPTFLSRVSIPTDNIHHIDPQLESAEIAAAAYEAEIKRVMRNDNFDLILLGLGSDGHTASLFPGKPALLETDKLVVDSTPGDLPPQVDRITFTYTLINAAKNVAFLVAGADKAEMVKQATQGGDIPAAKVKPASGEPVWFVDQAAANAA